MGLPARRGNDVFPKGERSHTHSPTRRADDTDPIGPPNWGKWSVKHRRAIPAALRWANSVCYSGRAAKSGCRERAGNASSGGTRSGCLSACERNGRSVPAGTSIAKLLHRAGAWATPGQARSATGIAADTWGWAWSQRFGRSARCLFERASRLTCPATEKWSKLSWASQRKRWAGNNDNRCADWQRHHDAARHNKSCAHAREYRRSFWALRKDSWCRWRFA